MHVRDIIVTVAMSCYDTTNISLALPIVSIKLMPSHVHHLRVIYESVDTHILQHELVTLISTMGSHQANNTSPYPFQSPSRRRCERNEHLSERHSITIEDFTKYISSSSSASDCVFVSQDGCVVAWSYHHPSIISHIDLDSSYNICNCHRNGKIRIMLVSLGQCIIMC